MGRGDDARIHWNHRGTADALKLAVITDEGVYLFVLAGKIPEQGRLFPTLYMPFFLEGMEVCAFTRQGLIVTAETGEILLFIYELFKSGRRP